MGVAVSWFVLVAYHSNTFPGNVLSLSCTDNQTLWTTDSFNCKNTQRGNTHEPWVLQNFSRKALIFDFSWITHVSSQQVCVCQHGPGFLSVPGGKPRSAPCCHTQAAAAELWAVIRKETFQISAVTVCCHTLEPHSWGQKSLQDDLEVCVHCWEKNEKKKPSDTSL